MFKHSTLSLYGTVYHNVEHSFKGGSGEELRGVAVDSVRASSVFNRALIALSEAEQKYMADIEAADKKDADWDTAQRAKRKADMEIEMQKYYSEKETRDKAYYRVQELKQLSLSKFWGLNSEEKDELKKAQKEADKYLISPRDYHFDCGYFDSKTPRKDALISFRHNLENIHAQCAVSLDCQHLSPQWAIEMYKIEQDATAWVLTKLPFAEFMEVV